MNIKKTAAFLTALTCCAGMLDILPFGNLSSIKTNAAEAVYNNFEVNYDDVKITASAPGESSWFFHDTFEGDTFSWQSRGPSAIQTSGRTAYAGKEALLIQNREASWNGAAKPLNPIAFVPGEKFSFSANVIYFDGGATDKFYMKLQYTDANGDPRYPTIAEGTAVKGEWIQLKNTDFQIPADATDMQLYIETAETTNNFYIDEAIGGLAGTAIQGAGDGQSIIKGDVDMDGSITALDMACARNGYVNGFATKAAELAADVDESGEIDESDLKLLQDYILCRISEFPVVEKPIIQAVYEKPRVININDLIADPDDEQSLVRMFATANMVDLEGIIVGTSCWRQTQNSSGMAKLTAISDAYGKVLPNLNQHAAGYPSLKHIQDISVMGQTGYSMSDVGAGKDTAGSELIIAAVDKDDDRPVWVNLWGGANTLAQALWKVKNTRSPEEVDKFIKKLRVYDILGQDEAGAWIVTQFPDLFYIRSTLVYGFGGGDSLSGDAFRKQIQSLGPMGALYPLRTYGTFEGDSPSFMYQIPTGMNDPEHIDWGSWGGRFSTQKVANIKSMSAVKNEGQYGTYYMYGDAAEKNSSTSRWAVAYQNDFLARMMWSVTDDYSKANHHPIAVLNGDKTTEILTQTVNAGSQLSLSANGSSDPDGNSLSYKWYVYGEPSTYKGTVNISNNSSSEASIQIPSDAGGKTIHVILEIHDNGSPELYAYRRLIINVK